MPWGVCGALLLVVAVQRQSGLTFSLVTGVTVSAGITIVTWHLIRDAGAAGLEIAGIVGAEILIIAKQQLPRDTPARPTEIVLGGEIVSPGSIAGMRP